MSVSVASGIAIVALLVWQFSGVADGGSQVQVLNSDLAVVWQTVIVASVGVSTLCSLVMWRLRRWTKPLALVNVAANVAAATLIVVLAAKGVFFAETPSALTDTGDDAVELTGIFLLLVVIVAIWDGLDGLQRVARVDHVERSVR